MSSQRGNTSKTGVAHQNILRYKADRSVKYKQTEIKEKRKLEKLIDYNVCARCSDKMHWKFKYGKYKPLVEAAKCKDCKKLAVRLAYRTICDACAAQKNQCPACCEFKSDDAKEDARMQALMKKAGISAEELEAAKRAKAGNAQVEPEGETAQGDDSDIAIPQGEDLSMLLDELAAEDDA